MGRHSKAQILQKDIEDHEDKKETFLIVYDFIGFKPSKRFWENLSRISNENEHSGLIQYSVYLACSLREAIAVARLAESYGADSMIFSAEEYQEKI